MENRENLFEFLDLLVEDRLLEGAFAVLSSRLNIRFFRVTGTCSSSLRLAISCYEMVFVRSASYLWASMLFLF